MDVWVEFKNASRWQAEALFRNFFPCEEDEEIERQELLDSVHLDDNIEIQELVRADELQESKPSRVYKPVDPLTTLKDGSIPPNTSSSLPSSSSSTASSTLWSLASSATTSLLNNVSITSVSQPPPLPKTFTGSPIPPSSPSQSNNPLPSPKVDKSQFGATNTAYLPPPPDASITAKSKPLDRKTLAVLAKKFADVVPEEEFSVAGLQGCEFFFVCLLLFFGIFIDIRFTDLLKHKAQPEAAANGVEAWVKSEREMRERLQREKDAREVREQALVGFFFFFFLFFF
jgi:mitochondrial chaperone BCS1